MSTPKPRRAGKRIVVPGTILQMLGGRYRVGAVLWLGERYYALINITHGDVSLFPASEVEGQRALPARRSSRGRA